MVSSRFQRLRGPQLVLAVLVVVLLASRAAATGVDGPPSALQYAPWLDTSDRAAVLAAYQDEFSVGVPPLSWAGAQASCDPGQQSPGFRDATIRRVNFYRAMAGVAATVTEDPEFSVKAQEAALMMSAEGALTHSPSRSFACFSAVGQEAAANSNLYLGRNGPTAIDGYIEDPGEHNADVGHRATILHPPTERMGVGDVEASPAGAAANALWVFDHRVFDEESRATEAPTRESDRFVAWPPRGYVPAALVHPRWSFTLAGADMADAEVAMYRPAAADPGAFDPLAGAMVSLDVVNRSGQRGHVPLPTVVWEPSVGLVGESAPDVDQHYLVAIRGVEVSGERRSFVYPVLVLGHGRSPELTIQEFLARLGR